MAVGRKGWMFSDTGKGAVASAILFSIVDLGFAVNWSGPDIAELQIGMRGGSTSSASP
jgi:hypothetical protein